jgi:hypothetical protein
MCQPTHWTEDLRRPAIGPAASGGRQRGSSLPTDPLERVVDRSDVDAHLDDASAYDDRRPGRAGRAARAPTTRRRPGAAFRRGRSPSSPARGTDRRFCHRAVAQLCPALRTDGSCSRTELSTMRRSEETREDTTLNDALSWATASSARARHQRQPVVNRNDHRARRRRRPRLRGRSLLASFAFETVSRV